MPLLFSYGTLREPEVQLSTYGRLLTGRDDELPRYAPSRVPVGDEELAKKLGRTHHNDATYTGRDTDHVDGTAFEVTDDELLRTDQYEAPFAYRRVMARLASGDEAWVYVHAPA